MKNNSDIISGFRSGLPICIGYFPAAVAFGLVAKDTGLLFHEAVMFSMTNFAGASQFFAVNLIASGALLTEVMLGVLLVNLRYLLMSASLSPRIQSQNPLIRAMLAFGNTDEVFTVASAQKGVVSTSYMVGIETVSWFGWVSGTVTGFLVGSILPGTIQHCIGITLYAMFTALLVQECRQELRYLIIAAAAGIMNTILVTVLSVSAGWSFAMSMTLAAVLGTWIIPSHEGGHP